MSTKNLILATIAAALLAAGILLWLRMADRAPSPGASPSRAAPTPAPVPAPPNKSGTVPEESPTPSGPAPKAGRIDRSAPPPPVAESGGPWSGWLHEIEDAAQNRTLSPEQVIQILNQYPRIPDKEAKKLLLWALGRSDNPSALLELVRLTKDPDAEIRQAAALGLQFRPESEATKALFALLETDSSGDVRTTCAYSLMGRDDSNGSLSDSLTERARLEPDPDVRAAIVTSLADYDDPDVRKRLLQLAEADPFPEVRLAAIAGLQRAVQDEGVMTALEQLKEREQDPRLRQAIEQTLLAIKGELDFEHMEGHDQDPGHTPADEEK